MNKSYLSCAETAALVRQALKEAYPAIKFSVRSDVYSGGASIRVRWVDGPLVSQVKTITERFEGAYFDGMIDYKGSIYHKLDGNLVHFGANFIFENRDESNELLARAIENVSKAYGGNEPITVEEFKRGAGHTWRNSGGCDLGRAVHLWLAGKGEISGVEPDQGIEPKPSPTADRVAFAGSDEYGAPYGTKGYPNYARAA